MKILFYKIFTFIKKNYFFIKFTKIYKFLIIKNIMHNKKSTNKRDNTDLSTIRMV